MQIFDVSVHVNLYKKLNKQNFSGKFCGYFEEIQVINAIESVHFWLLWLWVEVLEKDKNVEVEEEEEDEDDKDNKDNKD